MSATPRVPLYTRLLMLSALTPTLLLSAVAVAQTTAASAPNNLILMPPSTMPSAITSGSSSAPSSAQTTNNLTLPPSSQSSTPVPSVSQPFVGTITADRVYVRSGPGSAYYELGQLSKGDLVQVISTRQGWYQILPPNGTFCMVAKDLVEIDSTSTAGTAKADYVNVRAGTALNKNREPSAVLTVIRKGTKLNILGSTDKYYEVAPPEKAYVYISPQFVKNSGVVAEYKVPDLKLPNGATGPAKNTVSAPTTLPSPTVEISPAPSESNPTYSAAVAPNQPAATTEPATADSGNRKHTVVVPPQPTTSFSNDAYSRFNDLNARYQAELQKPVGHRDLDPLTKDYKALSTSPGLPPSVQQGSESRIAALEKLAAIQRLQQENATSTDAMAARQHALQEEYAQAQKAITDYEQTGPYLAEGRLQASTALEGKYALVNPATGRVVAYVDPQAEVDIGSLTGKYVGVRGISHKPEGTDITIIQVKNATLLPEPEGTSTPAR